MQWYVRRGGELSGPITDEPLREMAARGEIDSETLLWRPGDAAWQRASGIPGVITPPPWTEIPASPGDTPAPTPISPPPPELAVPHATEITIPTDLARPWPRYWARSFDVFIWFVLISIGVARYLPPFFVALTEQKNNLLFGFVVLPFVMIFDSIAYSLCGNTPGKWLTGIRVLDIRGGKVEFFQYLKRNFKVYVRGLGAGFPFITLFTMISAHRKAAANEILSWDRELETRAFRIRSDWWRAYLVACLYFGGIMYLTYLGESSANLSPEDRLRNAVAATNKLTPKMIDADTRLDSAEAAPNLTVQLNYTLVKLASEDLDLQSVNTALQGEMRNKLRTDVCSGNDYKQMRDIGATIRYRYNDKNGNLLGVISIPSSECTRGQGTTDERL